MAIGRAIVNKPPIILADEPTGNLDTKMGQKVIKIFKELNKEGHTILMVTHNEDNREHVQRTVYLKDGKLLMIPLPSLNQYVFGIKRFQSCYSNNSG